MISTPIPVAKRKPDVEGIRVKTLLIDLSHKFGGASSRVLTLMQNLPVEWVSLAVLADSPIAQEAHRLGLSTVIVGRHKANLLILFRLVSAIRKNGYQVLDTQNPQSKIWGSIAAWLTGIPLVSTLNSWYIDEHGKYSLKGVLYSLVELATNFSLSSYIVVSQAIFDALVRNRINPSNIHLIYNCVDTDPENVPSLRTNLMETYKLPHDSVLVAGAGRLVWAKGYDDLVEAFALLAHDIPNAFCFIAGDGELSLNLKRKIESSGLTGRIILLGHLSRDTVLSLIKACDLFVVSSRSEGTPMVVLEAASLGKPILATAVGGIPELLKHDEECVLVPSGDINALAGGIKRMLADKQFSGRLAERAYRRIRKDFSVKNQVQDTISVYNQAWFEHSLADV